MIERNERAVERYVEHTDVKLRDAGRWWDGEPPSTPAKCSAGVYGVEPSRWPGTTFESPLRFAVSIDNGNHGWLYVKDPHYQPIMLTTVVEQRFLYVIFAWGPPYTPDHRGGGGHVDNPPVPLPPSEAFDVDFDIAPFRPAMRERFGALKQPWPYISISFEFSFNLRGGYGELYQCRSGRIDLLAKGL